MSKRRPLIRVIGWFFLVCTIGIASCQALFADPASLGTTVSRASADRA